MPLEHLPLEISLTILGFLPPADRSRLCRTNKALYELCDAELYREEIRTQTFASIRSSCVLWAAYYGNIGTLRKAVRYGANITGPSRKHAKKLRGDKIRPRDVYTTLYVAIMADEYAMMQYLLENGADMHTPVFNSAGFLNVHGVVKDLPGIDDETDSESLIAFDDDVSLHESEDGFANGPFGIFGNRRPRRYAAKASDSWEFPLLEAIRQVEEHDNIQAAELLIRHGAYLIKPGITALDFYSTLDPTNSDLAGSDYIRKLLAKTPKKDASGQWALQNGGSQQTNEDKALLLRLLCGVGGTQSYIPPLCYASWIARPDLVEIAMNGLDLEMQRNFYWKDLSALGLALRSQDILTIKLVLSRSTIDDISTGMLVAAAEGNNEEMFKVLYEHDTAAISGRSDFGLVIGALSRPGKENLLKEVLHAAQLTKEQLADMEERHRSALFSAARNYYFDALEILLSHTAIAHEAAKLRPESALHYACAGKPDWKVTGIIGLLVRHGLPLESESDTVPSPLKRALFQGHVFAATALLKWGVKVDSAPDDEEVLSCMHYLVVQKELKASFLDTSSLIDVLVRRGAQLDRLSHRQILPERIPESNVALAWELRLHTYRATPLFFAALNGTSIPLVTKLLDSGASPTSVIIHKKSPMCLIAGLVTKENRHNEAAGGIFSLLMKRGARIDDRCGRDWGSALDRACYLSRGIRACCVEMNSTPCDHRCGKKDPQFLKYLLRYATKQALCLEHVQHHLINYHVKVKVDKGPRQWICRPIKQLSYRSTVRDITNDLLREFIKKPYTIHRGPNSVFNDHVLLDPSILAPCWR